MPTVNELLLDAQTDHAVDLQRYSTGVVRKIIALLNRVDPDLLAQLDAAIERLPAESFTVERLEALLNSVRMLNAHAYQLIDRELTAELRGFVEYEAGYQYELFRSTIPPQVLVRVAIAPVDIEQVYTAAFSRPFQGRLLKEWASSLEADRMQRIRQAVRIGYVENQTGAEIVRRMRGTRAKGYADGLIDLDRRHIETITRTAISHMAGVTRDRFLAQNDDVVKAVKWVSTLDTRTSEGCRLRDGLQYTADTHLPVGHKVPWGGGPGRLHMQCRSCSAPVLRSWKELGLDGEELSLGTRASMDGQVPADLTYSEWLKKQSTKRQDEILGPTRAALFRTGGMPLKSFSNDKGKWLTLDELKKKDAQAFAKAGLTNPIKPPPGVPKDEIARFLADQPAQVKLLTALHERTAESLDRNITKVKQVKVEHGYRSSVEQLASVRYYTGAGYAPINKRMREGGFTLEDRQFTALTASALPGMNRAPGEIWRAPTKSADGAERWWQKAVQGERLDLGNQLQSFSVSDAFAAGWAGRGDVLVRIAKPTSGAYIAPVSQHESELEVLLPPGLKYRVVGKSTRSVSGRTMRVIDVAIDDGPA